MNTNKGLAVFLFCLGLFGSIWGQAPIILEERNGIPRSGEPVTLGVPFARGVLGASSPKRIVDADGKTVNAQFNTMALWDDGSIKWLKCDFQADVGANATVTYTLKTDGSATAATELSVTETASMITVTTGPLRFRVNKNGFNLIDEARLDLDGGRQYSADEEIVTAGLSTGPAVTSGSTVYRASAQPPAVIEIEEQGPMKVVIKVSGRHYNGSDSLLKYETRIYAFAGKPYIKLWHVYANGKSVTSLGSPLDPSNSVSFDRYGLDTRLNLEGGKTVRFGAEGSGIVTVTPGSGETAALVQTDRTGTATPLKYTVSSGGTEAHSGSRAPGWGTVYNPKWGMTIAGRFFWQKYPKGISFKNNDSYVTASFQQGPTPEYLYVAMGTGDEILLYFHSADDAAGAGQLAAAVNNFPLVPRTSAQQYSSSMAFYPLLPGQTSYPSMSGYTASVTANHLQNLVDFGLYGNINFGDSPVDIWQTDASDMDATGWGSNYYDGNVLTPIRLFALEGDLRYSDIFIPGARHFMETACWNPFDTTDWLSGFCPSYSSYHRETSHFQQHYGEGLWYYHYLTGDQRPREIALRAAKAIRDQQWWGNQNVDCRMAYQRGSACLEAWKNTRDQDYLDHAQHLLVDKVLATQDKYGLIGASYEGGVIDGEQVFMMALYSDTLWKYILELAPGSALREELSGKLAKLADFIDTYARKSAGAEEYWNFFGAPSNAAPPHPYIDNQNPDATVYWWGKGLVAGTYAYAYHLTGQQKYKTLALNLLDHLWTAGNIDWGGSAIWSKPSGQVMKNVLHAVAIVQGTTTTPPPTGSIEISRTTLNFGAVANGIVTGSQQFAVTADSGSLSWTAAPNASWISCTPTSAASSQNVTVSVNAAGLSTGSYTGTVTVTAPGTSRTVTVNLTVKSASRDQPPFGIFSTPLAGAVVSGSIAVTGWVLDDVEIESVKIYNGQDYIGDAVFVDGARPDVETAYPGYPLNYRAGWGYMLLTNYLPNGGNGTFTLNAAARDSSGHVVTLGSKTVTCDNANALKPFGAIDTPAQGGAASGSDFINWGWVLTPQPNSIPTDGSTINVWIDGVNTGHPVYNIYRADIAGFFPGYANSGGAVGYFYLDTTQYENGVHNIYWTATDSAGNTDGIGSRYFTVQNAGGDTAASVLSDTYLVTSVPVRIKKGFHRDAPLQTAYPGKNGAVSIQIRELERLEIHLTPNTQHLTLKIKGFQRIGGRLRPLPVGSTLDVERGVFYWQPGPGFLGRYRLVFTARDHEGKTRRSDITVRIKPK